VIFLSSLNIVPTVWVATMRSTSSLLQAAVVPTVVAAVTITTALLWRRRHTTEPRQNEDVIAHKLLKLEEMLHTRDDPPISTLTWFRGDYTQAASILQRRVRLIMVKNPWLAGRVVKRRGKLILEYSKQQTEKMDDHVVILDPQDSPVSRSTPIESLGRLFRSISLKNGPNEPLFRVSIVPCRTNPQTIFCVILSLSHIVGDGATFYKIHNMLCTIEEDVIVSLTVERIATTEQEQAAAMGQEEYDFSTSRGLLINLLSGLLRVKTMGPAPKSQIVLVNDAKMQEAKKRAAIQANLPFVSTNDVLTSWFLQNTNTTFGFMNVNFRNRIPGHSELYAGNYENQIFYRRKDSATPGLVRKSLSTLQRTVTLGGMPTFWETLQSSHAVVSNWSSFAKPNVILGCTEDLHIPLYDVAGLVPYSLAVLVIFRSGPRGLALYMIGQAKE